MNLAIKHLFLSSVKTKGWLWNREDRKGFSLPSLPRSIFPPSCHVARKRGFRYSGPLPLCRARRYKPRSKFPANWQKRYWPCPSGERFSTAVPPLLPYYVSGVGGPSLQLNGALVLNVLRARYAFCKPGCGLSVIQKLMKWLQKGEVRFSGEVLADIVLVVAWDHYLLHEEIFCMKGQTT